MANWKKVIVSGSSAQLSQLSVDTNVNITGSLNASGSVYLQALGSSNQPNILSIDVTTGQLYYQGTGSFTANSASYALSASYASNASTADYATNAGSAASATSASYASSASTANTASFALSGNGTFSGSFSGSFAGNGSGLTDIPASGIVGLQLNQIASGSATASIAPDTGFTVNTDTRITGSLIVSGTVGATFDLNVDTFAFTGSLSTTGSVAFQGLTQQSISYLVGFDPTTGQLSYEGTGSVVPTTASFAISASHAENADNANNAVTASYADEAGKVTTALGSSTGITIFSYDGSSVATVSVSGAASLSPNAVTKWTGTAFANSSITDSTNVTINNGGGVLIQQGGLYVTGSSTFHDSLFVEGNFTVNGTASFQHANNLAIADQFILLNSGSTTFQDSGFVINTGNTGNSGSAFFLETAGTAVGTDSQNGRFAVAGNVQPDATAVTAEEYAVTTMITGSAPTTNVPQFGGTNLGHGNMWVDSNTGDIYIYA